MLQSKLLPKIKKLWSKRNTGTVRNALSASPRWPRNERGGQGFDPFWARSLLLRKVKKSWEIFNWGPLSLGKTIPVISRVKTPLRICVSLNISELNYQYFSLGHPSIGKRWSTSKPCENPIEETTSKTWRSKNRLSTNLQNDYSKLAKMTLKGIRERV